MSKNAMQTPPRREYVISLDHRKARGAGCERPAEILKAARELFLEQGVENVTTRQIAARVGISQTALYVYFSSKEEMLDSLAEEAWRGLADALAAADPKDAGGSDPVARLRAILSSYMRFWLRRPDDYRIIFMRKSLRPCPNDDNRFAARDGLLERLAERYPDCFTFACDGLVGATPELLVRRAGRQVSALVLGGTAPRDADPAQDEALGSQLLASAKNTEEHAYAVASIRDALRPLCDTLDVEARPALLKLPNLQHLGTHVRGTLADTGTPKSALALAAAVHPPAAVCGTPTGAALELIRELEQMDRERYAGPVGWMDADGNGEWGIALRCAQLSGRTARLFAGCGIVAGSDPAAELAETLVKFQPMRDALEG